MASTCCDHTYQCHWGEGVGLHAAQKLLHISKFQDYPRDTQLGFRPTQTESQGAGVNGAEGLLLVLMVVHVPLTLLSLRRNL